MELTPAYSHFPLFLLQNEIWTPKQRALSDGRKKK